MNEFLASPYAALAFIGAGVLVALFSLIWIARRRRAERPPTDREAQPGVDLAALSREGPPPEGPVLEVYGTPTRLAALILAPVGRGRAVPPREVVAGLMEQLLPGMQRVVERHHPEVRLWPGQVSAQGFTQAFFNRAALPGQRGKSTPWCSLAGRFRGAGRDYLVGLVCVAEQPNSLSQITIQQEGQWLQALRVAG